MKNIIALFLLGILPILAQPKGATNASLDGLNATAAKTNLEAIGVVTNTGPQTITGTGTGTGLVFSTKDSGGNSKFEISDNGRLGIRRSTGSVALDFDPTSYGGGGLLTVSNFWSPNISVSSGGMTIGTAGSNTSNITLQSNGISTITFGGAANNVRLPSQTVANDPTSAMTRGLVFKESAYEPIPMGWPTTQGTANTAGNNRGNDFTLTLSGTSVVGNNRYVSMDNPLYIKGSGGPMRMSDGRITYMFDLNFNGLVDNDVWFSNGVANGARLNGAAGWAVRWKNGGTVELQIHNGTTLQASDLGAFNHTSAINSWVVVWDQGTLYLYLRSHAQNAVPGRYVLVGSLVGTSVPATASSYYMTFTNECVTDGSFRAAYGEGFRFIRDAVHPNL